MEFNGIHLAHGPFVSSFNMSTRQWVSHIKFKTDIFHQFKTVQISKDPVTRSVSAHMNVGVILSNGEVYINLRVDP